MLQAKTDPKRKAAAAFCFSKNARSAGLGGKALPTKDRLDAETDPIEEKRNKPDKTNTTQNNKPKIFGRRGIEQPAS